MARKGIAIILFKNNIIRTKYMHQRQDILLQMVYNMCIKD